MQKENYLEYLEETTKAYPIKIKKYLVQQFLKNGVATKRTVDGQLCLAGIETVNISNKSLTEQLVACIKQSERAVWYLERWEFIKDYKYSVLFTCKDFEAMWSKIRDIKPLESECENEAVYTTFVKPVAYETDDFCFLKFNLVYAAIHPLTQEEFLTKYPFLIVFHKKKQVIEFRFDVLKKVFLSDKREQTVYSDLIYDMIAYFEKEYNCILKPIDLDFMVNVSKNDESVKLIAQYMKLPRGGNAQLEVGNNQEYMLPFIGELRSLLNDYQNDLEKVPDFKDALDQFMFEMEEMSDYPWIELLWENEIKTRSIHVKIISNYMNQGYSLIQHYYSNVLIGMERMNYVVEYIIDHRNSDTEKAKE